MERKNQPRKVQGPDNFQIFPQKSTNKEIYR